MADKTIFSDCLNNINTVVKTHKPLVYLSLKQKKRVTISDYSLVDYFNQISKDTITRKNFLETYMRVKYILENNTDLELI